MNEIVAGLLILAAALAGTRGARKVARGLRDASPLHVVRGIRGVVIALAATTFAAGMLLATPGLIVLGAVFLGEELYETAVLALIIRSGERSTSRR
jgi:hypothetical protein